MATCTMADDLESRILGTMYGNCIGDAIGLLTEFMSKKEASECYAEHLKLGLEFAHKVPDMHRIRWKTGDWTDDSDQMIVILDSLLEKQQIDVLTFGQKLKNWSRHGFHELGDFVGMGIGTTTHKVLHHAKYNTDPQFAAKDVWEKSECSVASNGAVMRTSILGIYEYSNIKTVTKNTLDICRVTHADPRCQASCVAVVTAIAFMLQKNPKHLKENGTYKVKDIIHASYDEAVKVFPNSNKGEYKKYCKELKQYTIDVEKLKSLKLDEDGKIGYTYKTLGAGFWALKQKDFHKALTELTMEAGDADTNGAVAGALLGCKLGITGLPENWLNRLTYKDWLDNKIYRFLKFSFPDMETKMVKETPLDKQGNPYTGEESDTKKTQIDAGEQQSTQRME